MWKRPTYLLLCYLCLQWEFKAPRSPEICYILDKIVQVRKVHENMQCFLLLFKNICNKSSRITRVVNAMICIIVTCRALCSWKSSSSKSQNHDHYQSSSIIIITTFRALLVVGFLRWRGKAQLGKERHLGQRPEHKSFVVFCSYLFFWCCCCCCGPARKGTASWPVFFTVRYFFCKLL